MWVEHGEEKRRLLDPKEFFRFSEPEKVEIAEMLIDYR